MVDACWRHRQHLRDQGLYRKHTDQQTLQLFQRLVMDLAAEKIFDCSRKSAAYQELLDDLKNREIDPVTAAERLLEKFNLKI